MQHDAPYRRPSAAVQQPSAMSLKDYQAVPSITVTALGIQTRRMLPVYSCTMAPT